MEKFENLVKLIQTEVPLKIKYKDSSYFMKLMNLFVRWFNPSFMQVYTTTIGYTIYFPSKKYITQDERTAMRLLTHEAVHLLDAKKYSIPVFILAYLFPQILVLGVFTFPFIGWWALLFLLFLAPIPAPFRFYFESRGYSMDIATNPYGYETTNHYLYFFSSWDYYKMYPFEQKVKQKLEFWLDKIDKREDKILSKCLTMYQLANEL